MKLFICLVGLSLGFFTSCDAKSINEKFADIAIQMTINPYLSQSDKATLGSILNDEETQRNTCKVKFINRTLMDVGALGFDNAMRGVAQTPNQRNVLRSLIVQRLTDCEGVQ